MVITVGAQLHRKLNREQLSVSMSSLTFAPSRAQQWVLLIWSEAYPKHNIGRRAQLSNELPVTLLQVREHTSTLLPASFTSLEMVIIFISADHVTSHDSWQDT